MCQRKMFIMVSSDLTKDFSLGFVFEHTPVYMVIPQFSIFDTFTSGFNTGAILLIFHQQFEMLVKLRYYYYTHLIKLSEILIQY